MNKDISEKIGGKPKLLIDIKGWLIYFNLIIDIIISHSRRAQNTTSLWIENDITEFEKAVLIIEDKRYFKHSGIDLYCAPRIIKQLIMKKRLGGISTIEQQYVRTVINKRERTIKRKSHEMTLSWLITKRLRKETILRSYLSSAYFGYKLNSCDDASLLIFQRPASELDQEQSAILASLLVYPLPKLVVNAIKEKKAYRFESSSDFFNFTIKKAPNWTNKIKMRKNYTLRLIQAKKA
ncbi:biosynthetic peptidoglycan transglycosylase [Halomonas sp. hl-4]|uniref:biosynthetic peptidoglycan transglycosylase n=1 Tax=Halomonas sp. hl-4 TaxID=1761789 RepID=UPI000BB6C8D6|nr:biosynthetic peptidoglycan transglycosylase [Halomonas sp. hl-4]SNY96861.1 Transglycosylase [Halomonas sp. hl-4]